MAWNWWCDCAHNQYLRMSLHVELWWCQYLLHLVNYFLDELLYLLKTNHFISVHYITIHYVLERAKISHKKLKEVTAERNERLRADFIGWMTKYDPWELGFLDEMSKDERTPIRAFGWAKKGQCAMKKAKFVCGRHLSTEALWNQQHITTQCPLQELEDNRPAMDIDWRPCHQMRCLCSKIVMYTIDINCIAIFPAVTRVARLCCVPRDI